MDMKIGRWKRVAIWTATAAVVATAGMTACTASGRAKGGGVIRTAGGDVEYEFEVNAGTGTFKAKGPADLCLEIEWRDSEGKSLGKVVVALPTSGQVPPGAVSWSAKKVDCPEPEHGGGDPSGDMVLPTFDVIGGPVVPNFDDGGVYGNATFHFRVRASADVDVFGLVDTILRAGPGAPVPAGLEVVSFTQVLREHGGVRLIAADTEPFQSFQLDWNGVGAYAVLGSPNSKSFSVGSWSMIEVTIPAGDLNGVGVANAGKTIRTTASDPTAIEESAWLTLLP
jgi:hypothetical protein